MPQVCYLPPSGTVGPALLPSLATLRRVMAAEGWSRRWRPRALPALLRHDAVPGLAAGPAFELIGDRRGAGWLEIVKSARETHGAERRLQLALEITRRPWGVLALLPRDGTIGPLLIERARDPAEGRRLASEAAERLLA